MGADDMVCVTFRQMHGCGFGGPVPKSMVSKVEFWSLPQGERILARGNLAILMQICWKGLSLRQPRRSRQRQQVSGVALLAWYEDDGTS
jgi:hypothetical protein